MFKTLVVGGTGFLGGAIVDSIARAGHAVTVLSRGGTQRELPGGTRTLHGDSYGNLDALRNERFDFVFDSCAFSPDGVENLLDAIGTGIRRYVLVSSISAYGTFLKPQTERVRCRSNGE